VPQLSLRRILLLIVGTLTLFITLLAAKDVYADSSAEGRRGFERSVF
jgi:hypothetical protein